MEGEVLTEDAEGKASHRWGKMEEDILPTADRSAARREEGK
jgi:hypothetical protein